MTENKNLTNSKCDLSIQQTNAVNNIGNKELISLMNKGNEYANSGNQQKASVYHSYVQEKLSNNYGIKFTDSSSQRASATNNSYNISPNSYSNNYYGFYHS